MQNACLLIVLVDPATSTDRVWVYVRTNRYHPRQPRPKWCMRVHIAHSWRRFLAKWYIIYGLSHQQPQELVGDWFLRG